MSNIQDKVVIITGASSGIGEAVAKELASKSANLVSLNYFNHKGHTMLYGRSSICSVSLIPPIFEAAMIRRRVNRGKHFTDLA